MSQRTQAPQRKPIIPEWLKVYFPLLLLVVGAMILLWRFVEPAPPKSAVIATGRADGEYFATAKRYAQLFADNGIQLQVRETKGSAENYDLLNNPDSGVDFAIVQGGMFDAQKITQPIEAVASIFYEPLWVFHRGAVQLDQISALEGKSIAIGGPGSGTRVLALQVLNAYGLGDEKDQSATKLLPLGGTEAASALIEGKIDALMMVASPRSDIVRNLLNQPGIELMSLRHAAGLSRVFTHLSQVTLYEGSIDPKLNLPRRSVSLIAPTATLVSREKTHKGLVLLAAQCAVKLHSGRGLLSDAGALPSVKDTEVPMAGEAKYFIEHGPSLLMRKFPFWLASWIERMIILLVPMLTLLIPIIRIAPPLYAWRVRAKILRWYKEIRRIDAEIPHVQSANELTDLHNQAERVRTEAHAVHVPVGYSRELYELCSHVDLVRARLNEKAISPPAG